MNRTYKIKLKSESHTALYLLDYCRNEQAESERMGGDSDYFIRPDGNLVSFCKVHMDKLADTVREWAAEIGAEGEIREITGMTPSF